MKLFKSYNFWIRLIAVLVLLLRVIGTEFGLSIDSGLIIDLATAIASVLVVLGVIQVPVDSAAVSTTDGIKNNGGENMNSFDKIKEDIFLAKDKLLTNFENSEVLTEITAILDGILGTSIGEDITQIAEESKAQSEKLETIEIESDKMCELKLAEETVDEKVQESLDFASVEETKSEEKIQEEKETDEIKVASEDKSVIYNTDPTVAVELTDEMQTKLNQALRAKIFEVLEHDLDDIIKEIS